MLRPCTPSFISFVSLSRIQTLLGIIYHVNLFVTNCFPYWSTCIPVAICFLRNLWPNYKSLSVFAICYLRLYFHRPSPTTTVDVWMLQRRWYFIVVAELTLHFILEDYSPEFLFKMKGSCIKQLTLAWFVEIYITFFRQKEKNIIAPY